MKQCLQETMPVVDVYKIKPLTTNDTHSSRKYLFKTTETMKRCREYV